ncbi:hypothetical protein BD626DRAFT_475203 [Schizophyllum amplum]|uniref:Uncharacterized protein n=1 Tax=Schizophyllum amplum TaxID=97359 RepID=A0A550CY93_9AGAR|nr:hypothetical protein BD626DRAFT_475203 [Auriculariopsis ampla]
MRHVRVDQDVQAADRALPPLLLKPKVSRSPPKSISMPSTRFVMAYRRPGRSSAAAHSPL